MKRLPLTLILMCFLVACSKRIPPARSARIIYHDNTPAGIPSAATVKKDVPAPVRNERRTPPVTNPAEFPKSITVNDIAASKSVDGRLYYDLKGHRYWKNYKDGKYYLFDKSMYNNPDFKPDTISKK